MRLLIATILLALGTGNLEAQTFSNGANLAIPDNGPQVCSNVNVTGVGTIDGTYGLETVCMHIDHTFDGDLDVFLIAPDGTTVELTTDNGGAGNNYGSNCGGNIMCFDMSAATSVTAGTAPFNGSFIPEGDLSDVNNGQNANGIWQLCIQDDFGGDVGILDCWGLIFSNNPAPPGIVGINQADQTTVTCAANYFDSGGTSFNYTSSESSLQVFCPATPGDYVSINFSSFNTEAGFDYMIIFDGNTPSAPIIGSYTGTTSPGTVTSSAPDGCLAIRFMSDGSATRSGWSATVSCTSTPGSGGTGSPEDCNGGGGTTLCSDATFSGNSSGAGSNELVAGSLLSGCLGFENEASWYYFSPSAAGTMEFSISPQNGTDDYDFAIWGPYAEVSCPAFTGDAPVRCSFSGVNGNTGLLTGSGDNSEDEFGDSFVNPLNINVGDVYVMLIDNFSATASPFDLNFDLTGGASLDCTPLTAEMTAFEGRAEITGHHLFWNTASEINNEKFLLQHSTDAIHFETIVELAGAGTVSSPRNYDYLDENAPTGVSYYRLKQVDYDGSFVMSRIVSLEKVTPGQSLEITEVFPVPSVEGVTVRFNHKSSASISLQLRDLEGRILKEQLIEGQIGSNEVRLSHANIESGMYLVTVVDNQTGYMQSKRIIIQR